MASDEGAARRNPPERTQVYVRRVRRRGNAADGAISPASKAEVVEWQTRRTQNPLRATAWGFDSPLRHQCFSGSYQVVAGRVALMPAILNRLRWSDPGGEIPSMSDGKLSKWTRVFVLLLSVSVPLTSCGGTDDGSLSHGRFLDSRVEGLNYVSGSESGITDAEGSFRIGGATIRFSVGDILIGEGPVRATMTPLDVVPGAVNEMHPTVTNIARFLLTLDADGFPNNGIRIREETRNAAVGKSIRFAQSEDSFTNDSNVQAVVSDLTSFNILLSGTLITPQQAQTHLRSTLRAIQQGGFDCDMAPQGEAVLRVSNHLTTGLAVAFGHLDSMVIIRPFACEVVEVPPGRRFEWEFTQCRLTPDSECSPFGSTVRLVDAVSEGEAHDFQVTEDLFEIAVP